MRMLRLVDMTRQTSAPLVHQGLQATNRMAREVARMAVDGGLDLDPPYQRGSVWTEYQRVALVRSWLLGIPIPAVLINNRTTTAWVRQHGDTNLTTGVGMYACVDGKQRIQTAMAWFASEFAVPASWFPSEQVEATEDTADGPYVRFEGLSVAAQRHLANRAMLPVIEAQATDEAAEADLYLLINMGGTPQTEDDLLNAAAHSSEM